MRQIIVVIILLAGSFTSAVADYPLEIIELRGRPAEEIVPLIKPFLAPDETVVGKDYKLIIRAAPQHLQELRRVLESVDKPPRRLLIHVRQRVPERRDNRRLRYGANLDLGKDTHVALGAAPPRQGVSIHAGSLHTRRNDETTQTIQTLEGHPAFISTGRSIPIQNQGIGRFGYWNSTYYKHASSGYQVVARIQGSMVTLEISQQRERPSSRYPHTALQIDTQRLRTTVTGRLGEWIPLGGINSEISANRSGVTVRASTRNKEDRKLELRVELLP